jgi:ZIP family zinc transporter
MDTTQSEACVLGLALLAGLSIPAGALVSSRPALSDFCDQAELDSFVSYFGGASWSGCHG